MIYPEAAKELSFVSFSYDTMFGELNVKWEKMENGFSFQLTIPHGMMAEVKGEKEVRITGSGEWSLPFTASLPVALDFACPVCPPVFFLGPAVLQGSFQGTFSLG